MLAKLNVVRSLAVAFSEFVNRAKKNPDFRQGSSPLNQTYEKTKTPLNIVDRNYRCCTHVGCCRYVVYVLHDSYSSY